MMEQIFDLQSFYDISIIKRENYENPTMTGNNHSNSKELNIYRLIYRDRIYYLQTKIELEKQDVNYTLIDDKGQIIHDIHPDFYKKFRTYVKLFSKSIISESISNLLHINEVEYLLNEINMDNPELEYQLQKRLTEFVNYQSTKIHYNPLLLSKLLVHNEFVTNYLLTNIGYPDESENYFNRMKIMIEQINERTIYENIPSYFDILRALLIYIDQVKPNASTVLIQGKKNHCLIKTSSQNPLSSKFIINNLTHIENTDITIIPITNKMISKLIEIYNDLKISYF